ncbi:MAG TPA: CoA transferase [Vicinamibacterales bacterium]|nr:CoA transferase [Vicinamibacterales bacterium]
MKALHGIRVLDLSRMVAGGIAGMLMADFGAEVVKIEQPGSGDPLRQWTADGAPLWWKVYARNKRFVTLNLKAPEGRALLLKMLPQFDVLMESFVPGTLERLGLDWDTLKAHRPGLILLRISGWGQTGPDSGRPGFGTLVEAATGFAEMNGEPDRGPIVPAFPLADSVSALYASNAVMFALYHRDVHHAGGQVIDVSLFESLFSLLGPLAAEYSATGRQRRRDGSRSRNAGPRGCYRTADGGWIAVSGSTPKMAERFLRSYGLDDLLDDPRFATNAARVEHARELDEAIAGAIAARSLAENVAVIAANQLTAIPVQTIADIEAHPHWRARGLTRDVPNGSGAVRMHAVVPRFSETPGEIQWAGGELGQDNHAIYGALGLTCDEQQHLRERGVI